MFRVRSGIRILPLLALLAGCVKFPTDAVPSSKEQNVDNRVSATEPQLEVAPPPREVVFVEITPAAVREIRAAATEMKVERWWLRYRLVPGGCTGFQNKLDLETQLTAEDYTFVANGIPCVVFKNQQHLVQGTQIDFGEKDGKRGFIVTAPHATQSTKVACQKWIMDEFNRRNPDLPRSADTKEIDE